MPRKMTKSILRPPFRPLQVPAAVRSSRLSCGKVGKAQIFTSPRESSGESRFKGDDKYQYAGVDGRADSGHSVPRAATRPARAVLNY
jgi:hypothetical protein